MSKSSKKLNSYRKANADASALYSYLIIIIVTIRSCSDIPYFLASP